MIIAITGGTGFVGKMLVEYHRRNGDIVRVLSRRVRKSSESIRGVRFYEGDISVGSNALTAFVDGADVLYHCAGELRDEAKMYCTHVVGTSNLIAAAKGRIGRWVQLSSVGVYGPRREGVVTEDEVLRPIGTYEMTKAKSDSLVMDVAAEKAFQCTILRPSIVFGDDMPNKSLFQMISMVNRGLFFFVGKPGAVANYVHVDSVVAALVRCGATGGEQCRIYNLSDHCTIEEFISMISNRLGRKPPKLRLPECPVRTMAKILGAFPGFPLTVSRVDALTSRSVYSSEKIERELGYKHVVSMEDGVLRLVEQWKKTA